MREVKETEHKQIGHIKLFDTEDLIVSILDNERLDLKSSLIQIVMKDLQKETGDFIFRQKGAKISIYADRQGKTFS